MQRQLYPIALGEDSFEQYTAQHTRRVSGTYLCMILLLVGGFTALPFVEVDVTVRSTGIVRPRTEKHDVRTSVSGAIERIFVHDNARVAAGDVIAILRTTSVDARDSLLAAQIAANGREIADLTLLAVVRRDSQVVSSRFQSTMLRQQYLQFLNELRDVDMQQVKATTVLNRTRMLYDRGFAAATDLEDNQYALERARDDGDAIVDRYRTGWEQALAVHVLDRRSLQSQRDVIRDERSSYTVRAPVGGIVEELASVSPSSFLQVGERVAIISPDGPLVAEAFVSPRDIGLVRAGMPARLRIDAFNYNDWGVVTGRVIDVSGDFVEVADQPMFKVRCTLDQDHLTLANGVTGRIRKGMTLSARFLVTRRSLFQLLRDSVSDWLDPTRHA